MTFGQLDYEIAQCEKHMDTTKTRTTEIENYLVGYLLVRICSEYESRIRMLVQKRCGRSRDGHLKKFVHKGAKETTNRFKISDLSGMLGYFGEDYKKAFSDAVTEQPANAAWDNIYNNRHLVAHGNGNLQMTFADLKRDYATSLIVLDEIAKALCLRPNELKGLN